MLEIDLTADKKTTVIDSLQTQTGHTFFGNSRQIS